MSAPPSAVPAARPDGRRLRSERTRVLIMEAYIDLLREQPEIPTAAQIAARAGISTRLIFERFSDLAALSLATVDHGFATAEAQAAPRGLDGDRMARIRAHVETRAQTCERWLPLWRALLANRGDAPEFRQRIEAGRARNLARLEVMYAPELGALDAVERRQLLIVLEALTDVDSWARMREFFGLSVADACATWQRAIDRLLPATPLAA